MIRPAPLLVSLLLGVILSACQTDSLPIPQPLRALAGGATEEQQIGAVLDDVHAGMQKKRIFQVMGHVSPQYRDKDGRNYQTIREYLQQVMDGYKTIRITRTPPRIQVQGKYARAVESFGTMAEPMGRTDQAPVNIQGQVVVVLEKIGSEWQILEWGPLY